jgi:PAS domain-containing protein
VDPVQQARRKAELRQKPVAALQPRVEEELRGRLRPKLEEKIRPRLIAALRPITEADMRHALQKALAPRVELTLKTRFAKTLVAQRAAETSPLTAFAAPDAGASLFERMLGSLGAPVFQAEPVGVCHYVSPAWQKTHGLHGSANLGAAAHCIFEPASQRALTGSSRGVANGNALRSGRQVLFKRREGESLRVEASALPLLDAGGMATGVCGLLRDVSELRRMSDQAEAGGVGLLLSVDQIDTGVMLGDADGINQPMNAALCQLLKREAAPFSLKGTPVSALFERVSAKVIGSDGYLKRMAGVR